MYYPHFISNNNPRSAFSHFEVSPMREDPETDAEYQREVFPDPDYPLFWGVYGRERLKDSPDSDCGGPAEHIADFSTEKKALAFIRRLNGKPIN